ncbi:Metallo-dependent phosphatase-like protein [Chaetomidium leptoderma]|uniref:Metallo-dependent phosphatase-like protein n=1 Tax=Chaetomidium leptoderma TaxID=669021 RepID=A0AAN6VL20_9PEZI|nr:Metallo-dependent phosphatase-like protein [Chaetomidium leptoderma]
MAPPETTQLRPGPRRRPIRSLLFLLLGGLVFLTLCLFTNHLPALQQLTSVRPFGGSAGKSRVTSTGAPVPHHQGPLEFQQLLDLIEQEKENKVSKLTMEYGTNKHPPFKDDPPLLVADLPQEYIPSYTPPSPAGGPDGEENKNNRKRLVILGDVHGQLAALKALLQKIGFDNKHGDHLVFAGDMVTKGPDSKGVVKLAMDLGASAVRGNQEDKVLAFAREIHRLSADDESRLGPVSDDAEDGDGEGDDKDGEAKVEARRKDHARKIARSLTRAQLAWLRSLPIILRIGHIPGATSPPWNASTIAVIHGGLVPDVKLEKQDPWAVMNMRSLVYPSKGGNKKGKSKHHGRNEAAAAADNNNDDDDDEEVDHQTTTEIDNLKLAIAVPIDTRKGEPWSHAWNRYQNHLPPTADHTTAIYGHDAKAGLQVNPEVDITPYSSASPYDYDTSSSSSSSSSQTTKQHNHHKNKNKKNKQSKKEKGLRYAFGLDSGCGHDLQLTALIIEAGPEGVGHRVQQVDCV